MVLTTRSIRIQAAVYSVLQQSKLFHWYILDIYNKLWLMCKVQAALMLDVPGCYGGWVEQSFDMFAICSTKTSRVTVTTAGKTQEENPSTNE